MTPEELRAIKERDALVDPYEFIAPLERIHPDGHESVHCVRDRRALLAEVEALRKALDRIIGCARVEMAHHPINGLASEMYEIALAAREKTT